MGVEGGEKMAVLEHVNIPSRKGLVGSTEQTSGQDLVLYWLSSLSLTNNDSGRAPLFTEATTGYVLFIVDSMVPT